MRIAIIGGGVYGTAIAYFLERFGDDDVTLYEKGHIAGGSTAYSAGIVRHHYTSRPQIELAKRGREILADLGSYIGTDGGFRQNGYLILADMDRLDEFRETVRRQQAAGIDIELVSPGELDDHFPGINSDGVELAAHDHDAGFADPYLVATAFGRKAEDLGAEVRTGVAVTDVTVTNGRATQIETERGTDKVDYVVNAAGASGREVGDFFGVDLPLERYESKIAVLSATEDYTLDYPTISDHSMAPDMYTKPEPGGDFIVGGIERPKVDPASGTEGVTTSFLREVADRLEHRLPKFSDAQVAETWSGVITVTPDSVQIAGVPEGLENVYNIVGGSGHGFKEAPAFAESIAQEILGREPENDLTPFRAERFETGKTFDGISAETYGDTDYNQQIE